MMLLTLRAAECQMTAVDDGVRSGSIGGSMFSIAPVCTVHRRLLMMVPWRRVELWPCWALWALDFTAADRCAGRDPCTPILLAAAHSSITDLGALLC